MEKVYPARPYRQGALSSLGNASYMLLRQYKFPNTHQKEEPLLKADHDRCSSWDGEHFNQCCQKHLGTGELAIGEWVRKAEPSEIIDFLIDVLKADTKIKWTGFRVSGTVNRSDGSPVFTLELFSRKRGSGTKVYSTEKAPNVRMS